MRPWHFFQVSMVHLQNCTYSFVTPIFEHLQLSSDHGLWNRSTGKTPKRSVQKGIAKSCSYDTKTFDVRRTCPTSVTGEGRRAWYTLTSKMLGIMSLSHCLRKESLSKEGSTFRISVSTSDISVLEKSPPARTYHITLQLHLGSEIHERHGPWDRAICHFSHQ